MKIVKYERNGMPSDVRHKKYRKNKQGPKMLSFEPQNLGSAEPGPLGPPYLLLVVRSAAMRPIY